MADDLIEIPPEFEPNPGQIPAYATDVDRYRICFAVTRQNAGRDDPLWTQQLYEGDIPTGNVAPPHPSTPAAQQAEHD